MAATVLHRSYFHQPGRTQLKYWTIPNELEDIATHHPERAAYIFRAPEEPRKAITYQRLSELSDHVGAALHRLGIKRGERVAILGPNELEWVIGEYGILKAGAASVHLSMSVSTEDRLQRVLNMTRCVALLFHPGTDLVWYKLLKQFIPQLEQGDPRAALSLPSVPTLRHLICMCGDVRGAIPLQELMEKGSDADADLVQQIGAAVSPDDEAVVLFTSGSTGFPKAVLHSHSSVLNMWTEDELRARGCFSTEPVVFFNDRPFAWAGGSPFWALFFRASIVTIDAALSVKQKNVDFTLKVLEEENCNFAFLMPYLLHDIVNHPSIDEYDLSHLRSAMIGGQIVSKDLMKRGIAKIAGLLNVYGSGEMNGVAVVADSADSVDIRVSTIGRVLPHFEMKVVDESGSVLPINTPGEICARGPSLMLRYDGDPERTREAIDDARWCHFGDVGIMDERGRITVVGRKGDAIKRATVKLFPQEVENPMLGNPAISKVQVVGVPDERYYQEVCACVELKQGSTCTVSDIESWCRALFRPDTALDGLGLMPGYFLLFDSFPLTSTGKFDRMEIGRMAQQMLNLATES